MNDIFRCHSLIIFSPAKMSPIYVSLSNKKNPSSKKKFSFEFLFFFWECCGNRNGIGALVYSTLSII